MSTLKYATIACIPNEEDNFQCYEPILQGSEVLVVLEEDGREFEFPLPAGARYYKLLTAGAAVSGKFFDSSHRPIEGSVFSL